MTTATKPQLLSAEQLEGCTNTRFKTYAVPVLEDTSIRVKSLSEWEQAKFERQHVTKSGGPNHNAIEASRRVYLSICIVDDNGNNYLKPEYFERVDSKVVNCLYGICARHNGLSESEQEALLGNFE